MEKLIVNQVKDSAGLMLSSKYNEANNPGSERRTICGATTGWVITVNQTLEITLVSVFTQAQVQLPKISCSLNQPLSNLGLTYTKNYVVHKAVLSSTPDRSPVDYVVMIIFGKSKELAYYKAGNKTWTLLKEAGYFYDDVIFHKENFFAVDEYGKVVLCKPDSSPTVTKLTTRWFFWGQKIYLVSIGDKLGLVIRYMKDKADFGSETYYFKVFMLDHLEKRWNLFGDVGNWAILLGHNHSVALSPNKIEGLKPNTIYFKDDNVDMHKDDILVGQGTRVFNLNDDSIEQLLCPSRDFQNIWQQQIFR